MVQVTNPRDVQRDHKAVDCVTCSGKPPTHLVANYDFAMHDGEVICNEPGCGRFIRDFDAG